MNPLENAPVSTTPQAVVEQESQRAVAEVKAAMVIARGDRRNLKEVIDNILVACQRPGLAESAVYSYARGGTDISGPSIRMAECIAQNWRNIQFGTRELEQRNGESTMQAYAWDLENNAKYEKTFQVKHIRYTKARGAYSLEDPRDIAEMNANQGARRLRAVILGLIPSDIVEMALAECERTMKAKADVGPEGQAKLVKSFQGLGVSKEQIEKRIQRRIDTITAAQMVSLRKVFNSLRDGMSTPPDWFETDTTADPPKSGAEAAKEALRGKKGKDITPPAQPPPQEAVDQGTGEVKPTTTRDKAEMIACPRDGESRSVGWCSDSCPTAIDCIDWR